MLRGAVVLGGGGVTGVAWEVGLLLTLAEAGVAPVARGGGPIPGPRSQAEALRAQGARVVLVAPDADSVAAIGSNVLDPSRRAPSARAGREQAGAQATEISTVWS